MSDLSQRSDHRSREIGLNPWVRLRIPRSPLCRLHGHPPFSYKSFLFKHQKYTEISIVVGSTFTVNSVSKLRNLLSKICGLKSWGAQMIEMVNGTVEVLNPAEILRNQDGVFEVTSPYGHVFRVTCRRGAKMSVREISEPQRVSAAESVTWRIKRVARAVA